MIKTYDYDGNLYRDEYPSYFNLEKFQLSHDAPGGYELYNLSAEVSETKNLASDASYDDLVEDLDNLLMDWLADVEAEMPMPRVLNMGPGSNKGTFYSSIQKAINEAFDGDTIVVCPAEHQENIKFKNNGDPKDITLTSINPDDPKIVQATVIDGDGSGPVVTFDRNNGTNGLCILKGFTITGGTSVGINGYGAGSASGAEDNVIIKKCIIKDNQSRGNIDGITNFDGIISQCTITNISTSGKGSGLVGCDGAITNCTIVSNSATPDGHGVYNCNGVFTNCIIWYNNSRGIMGGAPTVTYSNVRGGYPGKGNIDSDPKFADSVNGNYHLQGDSPCIDAGDNNAISDSKDFDGQVRFHDNPEVTDTGKGAAPIIDMGVYEWNNREKFKGDSLE